MLTKSLLKLQCSHKLATKIREATFTRTILNLVLLHLEVLCWLMGYKLSKSLDHKLQCLPGRDHSPHRVPKCLLQRETQKMVP